MAFINDNDKVPIKAGKYMKLKIGENRFRVLGDKISGWEGWKTNADGKMKPVRCKEDDELNIESIDDPQKVNHFWAFPVWNYEARKVQIFKVTQGGIKNDIMALGKSKKWGDPYQYDIVIHAIGEGLEREYSTQPDPKEPLNSVVLAEWEKVKGKLNMEVYFDNGDPFGDEINVPS